MSRAAMRLSTLVAVVVAAQDSMLFSAEPARPLKRARPPVWSRDVLDAFFDDARDKLDGPRPEYGAHTEPENSTQASLLQQAGGASEFAWSKLIDADTIETEIKRLSQSIDSTVTTPSEFKAGGYKAARRDFSLLAVLFAVTGEYDGQARWQDAAAGLRELFARAGYNAKVGSDPTYREATQRKQDLADLVRGGRPQVPQAAVAASIADWSQIAARPPLMQRLNIAHEERLTKWLTDASTFRRNRNEVEHEAQLVAMIAEVIGREGFDFSDDQEYATYARKLRQAATDVAVAAAADADNYERAIQAIGRATKACSNCHDGYRG